MLYHLAGFVRGEDTRRWLRIFAARPERPQGFWILAPLRDPAALPILRYWSTLPAPKDQAEILNSVIDTLAKTGAPATARAGACCQPTEACLVAQATPAGTPTAATIQSEDEAATWLATGSTPAPESSVAVRFVDVSKRAAIVRVANGAEQRWQYLYDCWHRVDRTAGGP